MTAKKPLRARGLGVAQQKNAHNIIMYKYRFRRALFFKDRARTTAIPSLCFTCVIVVVYTILILCTRTQHTYIKVCVLVYLQIPQFYRTCRGCKHHCGAYTRATYHIIVYNIHMHCTFV